MEQRSERNNTLETMAHVYHCISMTSNDFLFSIPIFYLYDLPRCHAGTLLVPRLWYHHQAQHVLPTNHSERLLMLGIVVFYVITLKQHVHKILMTCYSQPLLAYQLSLYYIVIVRLLNQQYCCFLSLTKRFGVDI